MPPKQKKIKEKLSPTASGGATAMEPKAEASSFPADKLNKKGKKAQSSSADRKPGCPVLLEGGCELGEGVDPENPGDAVRMFCTNENCPVGSFIHLKCYETFENRMVRILSGVSWARSWTDQQRRANLWDKKGYQLISKMCKCTCGKGQYRKDLDYSPPASSPDDAEAGGKSRKKKAKQLPALNQADYRSGFINKQLPNVGTGAASANKNKIGNFDFMLQGCLSDSPQDPFDLEEFQAREAYKALSDEKKETVPLKEFLSDYPLPSFPPPFGSFPVVPDSVFREGVHQFFRLLRSLLERTGAMEVGVVNVSDKRIEELVENSHQLIKIQIQACGGLKETLRRYHRQHGIDYYENELGDGFIFLRKGFCQPPFTLYPPPPLPTAVSEDETPTNTTGTGVVEGKGVIQNLFQTYGYIRAETLDSNIFFVPSHVKSGPSSQHTGWGWSQYPSLHSMFRVGDLVEFQAEEQQEKNGCRYLARVVTLLSAKPPGEPVKVPDFRSPLNRLRLEKIMNGEAGLEIDALNLTDRSNISDSKGAKDAESESSLGGISTNSSSSGTEKRLLGHLLSDSAESLFSKYGRGLSASWNCPHSLISNSLEYSHSLLQTQPGLGGSMNLHTSPSSDYDIFKGSAAKLGEWILNAPPDPHHSERRSDNKSPSSSSGKGQKILPIGSHLSTTIKPKSNLPPRFQNLHQ